MMIYAYGLGGLIALYGVILLAARMRMLGATAAVTGELPRAERYQPMLRLLQDSDYSGFAGSPRAARRFRSQRRKIFRGYLRCLAKDYGQILAGIRAVMTESGIDRPELVTLIARSRVQFALALCRIEIGLRLQALGIGSVDVSGLVRAFDAVRSIGASISVASTSVS